ncbi:serine/threonine-protein kinase gin4 [Yamadazyma tenuis]|uniref:serine/threonine-protein kinase gin4 n=1 Tax=Candida tenuis TaxID=2315449 RepID=UPI0027A767D5|nr:serine/threonine-protein kinase gin4 [Yamadazyma tenuis]
MSYHSRQPSIASSLLSRANSNNHPQFIGPWRLGRTLGRGATGRVLLATHKTNGQKAAVKVVSKSELDDEDTQKPSQGGLPYGIEREIIIMKLLTHPNVLRLYDVWETSKNLYLVLEYVEGGELFDLLVERGPLPESEAVKYFRQIVLGTAYCHALGICHRDLKPENLLLDSNLNVKLADFGMAALESNGKLLETSCGSPHYAAPEIVSGLKYHGSASDVWSGGVILFALLTGRLPFDDENIRDLLLKVQAGSFEMPTDISWEAQDLIGKMLTANPDKRIATNDILKHPMLTKYPMPNEDLISVKSLPHPQTAHRSLGSVKNIDKQILQNLSILWNDRPEEDIIKCLLTNGNNPEKTFYALLMRYRHNHDESLGQSNKQVNNNGRIVGRSNSIKGSPKKKRTSQISASSSRHRPVSFQYKNRTSMINTNGKISASSSVQNSPYRSPRASGSPRKYGAINNSPYRGSPRRSPMASRPMSSSPSPAIPRNIYNEIVSAQQKGSYNTGNSSNSNSMPPSLPSKDSIDHYKRVSNYNTNHPENKPNVSDLMESANLSPGKGAPGSPNKKRNSLMRSLSKNRLSRRKSMRASMTSGLKRNSITIKLLSTYAKLSNETDWEYMDKQTRRTSATFAQLCDKIFNQEDYNEDEENLVDEEEKEAREYERLMEIERKKHEAELKARKELAKQRKRQKRKSLLSSKKLSIFIKDDANNSEMEVQVANDNASELTQPKRKSKLVQSNGLRSISEGAGKEKITDELTAEDLENIKRRSVTQPIPRQRKHPILTRRPVSRLDPLWTAYENEELDRAKEALDAEYKDSKGTKSKKKTKSHSRESMISVVNDDSFSKKRLSKQYQLPEVNMERSDLSDEYLSEIRKSRLLNSQMNISSIAKGESQIELPKKNQRHRTLIGDVNIPNVTRKSRHFTNSNKRLSVLSLYSTKESYRDLSSVIQSESKKDSSRMPHLRTSFADRLDRAGLVEEDYEEDDEPLDEGSIMDFEEHLANKRASYYTGRTNTVKRYSKAQSNRPLSQLPNLPPANHKPKSNKPDTDYPDETFSTKADRRRSKQKDDSDDYYGGLLDRDDDYDDENENDEFDGQADDKVFDNIKLPPTNGEKRHTNGGKQPQPRQKTKSMLPSAESMLIPNFDNHATKAVEKPRPYASTKPVNTTKKSTYPGDFSKSKPLEDTTNKPDQKKNKSIFRKLSWGTRKTFDDVTNPQLPSPADSFEEKKPAQRSNSFFKWFSSSSSDEGTEAEIKRFNTILPKQEMSQALFALLNSWSNFGLKNLKNDHYAYIISGGISKHNAFNLKSCKFRIKINTREFNQKSEIVCARVKGSRVTSNTLFKEIEKVLLKEGVMDS